MLFVMIREPRFAGRSYQNGRVLSSVCQ